METRNTDGMDDFERLEHDHATYRNLRMMHLRMAICGSSMPIDEMIGKTMVVTMFSLEAFTQAFPDREARARQLVELAMAMEREQAAFAAIADKFRRELDPLLRKLDRMRDGDMDDAPEPTPPPKRDPWDPPEPKQRWLFPELAEDEAAAERTRDEANFEEALEEAKRLLVDRELMEKCANGELPIEEELAVRKSLRKSPASLQFFCDMLGERVRAQRRE